MICILELYTLFFQQNMEVEILRNFKNILRITPCEKIVKSRRTRGDAKAGAGERKESLQ